MEKKKMKLWKKFLLVFIIILLVLAVVVLWRFSILTKINEKYYLNNNKSNLYYYSKTDTTIMEFYKKDGIIKENIKQANGNGDITIWKNYNTGESLIFYNSTKLYTDNNYRIY